MAWSVEFSRTAERQIRKLSQQTQISIPNYFRERGQSAENVRQHDKALQGEKKGLWRYRVGDYRVICDIRDSEQKVAVLAVGHRREVYR